MVNILWSTSIVILCVEVVVGNLGNGFIALVNYMDWVKKRKMSSIDQILTALALSRLGLLWIVLVNVTSSPPSLLEAIKKIGVVMRVVCITWIVMDHFNVWLASSLSIFYFLKIARFSNSVFLYLKWRVKKVVVVTLLASLVFLFPRIILMNTYIDAWIEESKRNTSHTSSLRIFAQLSRLVVMLTLIFLSVPFFVSLTALLLLIFSLWKHHKKMQHNAQGSRDASIMEHIKAVKTVIAFLLLYTILFLSVALQLSSFDILEKFPIMFMFHAAGMVFPSVHSCVLILGNSKLRQASLSVLQWVRYRCKDGRPSCL
ncbi:taste receptor type 2 member 125-like [Castor canadensis]|uniref:Taste receptor type 2 n=1 Tax=Castor canadensis TaxID=51338 RepID=A0A8B7TNM4_CASCN